MGVEVRLNVLFLIPMRSLESVGVRVVVHSKEFLQSDEYLWTSLLRPVGLFLWKNISFFSIQLSFLVLIISCCKLMRLS